MSISVVEKFGASLKEFLPTQKINFALSEKALDQTVQMDPVEKVETLIDSTERPESPIAQLEQIVELRDSDPDTAETLDPIIDSFSQETLSWLSALDRETKRVSALKKPFTAILGVSEILTCLHAWDSHHSAETEALALSAIPRAANSDLRITYMRAFELARDHNLPFDTALGLANAGEHPSSEGVDSNEYRWTHDSAVRMPGQGRIKSFYDERLN